MKTDLTQTICLGNIKGGAHEAFVDPLMPETTALIIVDMQGPPERAETEPMRTALASCVRLLEMARSIPIPVIHVHLGWALVHGSDCWHHGMVTRLRQGAMIDAEPEAPPVQAYEVSISGEELG